MHAECKVMEGVRNWLGVSDKELGGLDRAEMKNSRMDRDA